MRRSLFRAITVAAGAMLVAALGVSAHAQISNALTRAVVHGQAITLHTEKSEVATEARDAEPEEVPEQNAPAEPAEAPEAAEPQEADVDNNDEQGDNNDDQGDHDNGQSGGGDDSGDSGD